MVHLRNGTAATRISACGRNTLCSLDFVQAGSNIRAP